MLYEVVRGINGVGGNGVSGGMEQRDQYMSIPDNLSNRKLEDSKDE